MATTQTGRSAEEFVSNHLTRLGYQIVAQNWRTRSCEIDIVATKHTCVYFIEVKYRKNNTWGDGLEAITPTKMHQMTFAAQQWVLSHNWHDDYRLMVASVEGDPYTISAIIEID